MKLLSSYYSILTTSMLEQHVAGGVAPSTTQTEKIVFLYSGTSTWDFQVNATNHLIKHKSGSQQQKQHQQWQQHDHYPQWTAVKNKYNQLIWHVIID